MSWYLRCSWCGGPFNGGNCWRCTNVSFGDEFVHNSNPILNNETPDFTYPPSQPQTSSLDQLHYFHCKDPLEEGERVNDVLASDVGVEDPKDSLIMRSEDLSTIPKKESNEFIKSSVENLVPIPSEFEDTSESDSECDLLSCDDFSPINISEGKSMSFSKPFFDSNDDFTSSDDESLSDEDVLEDNVLENIENKDFYDSNLDESDLPVTSLFGAKKDECFDPRGDIDEIDALVIPSDFKDGYYDSEGDVLYLETYENSLIYEERTKKLHDDKIKNRIFNVGDQVLLFNSRLKIFSGFIPWRLKTSCVGYCPGFQDLRIL
uniref:Reverse transcriptase domain-containing protein n=1 Tax=Tanacetum cinerariifolium TaxID=118510 RepID=A0A6L2JDQ1_TANCI|nr:reverse transcriptase domain-containing protein [Tanacetum cinerariifolium]